MAAPGQPSPDERQADEQLVRDLAEAARAERRPGDDEHSRLLDAAAQGDQQARDSLTRIHLDWVAGAARERAGRGLSQGDLFQEGTIGLMLSIEQYHSSGQPDFETYARRQVAAHMDQALGAEEQAVRESQLLLQAAQDYVEAELTARRDLGRPATDVELAQKLEWPLGRTREVGQMVEDARRRHDEELLEYLDPDDVDLTTLIEERPDGDGG